MTEATAGTASVFQTPAGHSSEPVATVYASVGRAIGIAALCALATLLVRILLIAVFGSSLPFWDQWGAEGAILYQPLVEHRLDWSLIGVAHNEHRIALTRLVALGLFAANDYQWDVRIQLLANGLIFALALGVLVYYLQRHVPRRIAGVLSGVALLIGVLPFAWENTVAGFQNGFYFLFLSTVLMLWVSAHRRASPTSFVLLALLSVFTLFTIATGLLTLAACLCVLLLRIAGRENSVRGMLPLLLVVVVALVAGALTLVRMTHHEALAAQGVLGHLRAIAVTTSWPLLPPATLLFAAPFCVFAWRFLRERRYDATDAFFAGLFVWAALICLATAHSRGHDLRLVPSRYTDLFALGSLAYVYFALRLRDGWPRWRRLGRLVAVAVPLLVALGLVAQSIVFWPFLQERRFLTRIEAINVRAFLEGEAGALYNKPPFYIPVPDGAPLAHAFASPVFRGMVPVSVAPAGDLPALPPRACAWQASAVGALPQDGDVDCAATHAPDAVELGRLSALSFRLWQWLYVDTFPALRSVGVQTPPIDGVCAVDAVNLGKVERPLTFRVYYPSVMRFSGWTGGKVAWTPRTPVRIALQSDAGELFSTSGYGRVERADVVAAYNDPSLLWSGFDLAVTGDTLPQGRYRLLLGTQEQRYCETGHYVEVARAGDERLNY